MERTINYKLTSLDSNTGQDADVRARAIRKGEERFKRRPATLPLTGIKHCQVFF